MGAHSKLSPSSSSRWLTCTKSIEMEELYPNTSGAKAVWGTYVHYIGELLLLGNNVNVGDELVEPQTGDKFEVDEEMLDTAMDYANYVFDLADGEPIFVEQQYDLSFIAPDTWGTADATVIKDTTLHVCDLKTGRNKVYARENTQLMLYALGAYHHFKSVYIEDVEVHIIQSRIGWFDSWKISVKDLLEFEKFAKEQATKIVEGKTTYNPSDKACRWCRHQAQCTALANFVEETLKGDFDNLEDLPDSTDKLDTLHIKRVLDNKDLINSFLKSIEQEAKDRLLHGETIDGYKLVEAKTHRKWRDEEQAAEVLKSELGDATYKKTLITPTQAVKKLKDKKEIIEDLFYKPPGEPTIAPITDRRKALEDYASDF